ncbi:FAD-binding protein [Lachnospiraceae bacterium]|jgi:glycerol-3-phosphate dehydrogenase subunit B|nr:FAD-binding protein [uncultured Schaedlerella sp.]MCI9153100.1 FAD-binding protein [Ruminococcus sp.]NBI58140.1 FAD-binding protein [Lachnospiraceae bacterium]
MKNTKYDVLIAGGGIAGCAAAKAAADEGKSVAAIFPNGGASEISSGTIDICGVVPGVKAKAADRYEEGISQMIEAYPGHPYQYSKDKMAEGVAAVIALASKGGFQLYGFEGKNVWLPNMMGTFSIAAFVPFTSKDVVCCPREGTVLAVGLEGNVNFNAEAAAQSYNKYQKQLGFKETYYSVVIRLDGMKGRHKLSDSELADYLDTPEGIQELSEKLAEFCANNRQKFDKILLPPVLGFVNYHAAVEKLKADLGCSIGEVITFGNPVVGYRMTRAIYRGLEESGVTLLRGGKVDAVSISDGQVTADCTLGLTDQLHAGRKVKLQSSALVLATGGFLGGGMEARRRDIWLNLLEENLGEVTAELLNRNPVYGAGQDALRLGASVHADLSVKNEKFKGRVFACGDLLAGHNSASERSGSGVAASTGWLAGINAAKV